MAKAIGRTSSLGLTLEATRGTAETSANYWIPVTSYDFDDRVSYIDNDSAMARIEEKNDARINQRWADGSYEGKVFLQSVGAELAMLFGQSPTSTQRSTSGVYDHDYTVANNNQHKSATIFYKSENEDTKFPLGMMDSWSLTASLDNFVSRNASILGKPSEPASNTVSLTDENEFIPSHIEFRQASSQSGLSSASEVPVTNFQFEVAKNPEALFELSTDNPSPGDIVNKQFAVTGSFQLYFQNTTQRDKVFNDTKEAMRIRMVDTTIDLGSGNNPELYFDFNKVKYEEWQRNWAQNDILQPTINFEALYSIGDGALITSRLTNTVTSY